jgi:hypothetical protein
MSEITPKPVFDRLGDLKPGDSVTVVYATEQRHPLTASGRFSGIRLDGDDSYDFFIVSETYWAFGMFCSAIVAIVDNDRQQIVFHNPNVTIPYERQPVRNLSEDAFTQAMQVIRARLGLVAGGVEAKLLESPTQH